ncbi:two-component regulator propeller domain-containing protein [uncultured Parabacteroides sp.]|uniref:hybrid sensor histidine kinase/response regulator transcription factor n=1 Tax=uncultured Parabacteroides sp. TaxID=512312 RepID=UPI00262CB7F5|nr:two-component regulator propeller domain-containing protein [uncultured Parabacteroides sp.]
MKKLLVILLGLFLCMFPTQAETPNYYFKQISLKDGLSQSTVNCVLSDHQGVIWIGTSFGLNRFDRERIMSYKSDKDHLFSIPGNTIIFLTEDLRHNIWIGTDRGLARYDGSKDRFVRITFAGLPLHVRSSVVTDNGILFFGAGTAFAYSYADNRITVLPVNGPEKITSVFTHAYMYDKQKQIVLLVCRRNGLWWYHFATGKLERVPFIPAKEVTSVCLASSGDIWLSVYADGVYGYTPEGQERYHLNTGNLLNNDVVLDIKERDGELWLATDGGGINIYDPEKQTVRVIAHVAGDNNSLPVNSFGCLYSDQEKNMWAGSIRGGLIGMKEINLYTYGSVPLNSTGGLSYKTVTSLYEDRDHILWLGTDGDGINRFDPRTGRFRHYPATFGKKVVSIVEYDEDELLLSIFSQGLYRFHKETGELHEYVIADAGESRRLFRFGLAVHLDRLDKERFYIYSDSVYLYDQLSRRLDAIRCKEEGVVLSALMKVPGDGPVAYLRSLSNLLALDHKDGSMRVFYTPPDSIGTIGAACRDKAGGFWLGTSSGLYRYDPATKRTTAIEENRFAGTSSLGFDRQGRLWIGTHNGLYAYIPEEGKTVVFGESDGVYANEYLFKPPLLTASGDLYMAGVNGLVYIRNNVPFPEEVDPSINLLDVELDGISVGSDVIRDNNRLSIPWNYTSLNARIIVKENDLMRKKLFRYYIKGSQNEMIERSGHTISFHALSVGEYHIGVSCNKRNGDWSAPVQLLVITVTPPWWKTTGFLILLVLLILGGSALTAWLAVLKKERKMVWAIKEHERKTYEDRVRFLINISHELRTPLTLIYAPLKRLLASGEVKDDKLLRLLTGIFRQTRRIKDNINMVLDVRKMEIGGESLNLTRQSVNDWLREISGDFALEFQVRNIRLVYDFDESLGEVPFDVSKCEIVLSNLLMNALKFSEPNTVVVLSTRRKPDYVRISLSDEGLGLDHVEIDRLFTRFYQGEHDRKGSGIGLSYARMLVEMHGGNIGAQANEGRGATFFFELPLENTSVSIEARPYMSQLLQTSDVEIPDASDYPLGGYTVMVVEDEPELRDYLKDELSGYFKEVYVAEEGRQALEMIQAKLPDLVVSDVMMPYMNGFELCRRIKSDVEISHIPVILLTARTDNESAVQGYKLGADMYVPKPFDLAFLLVVLRNLLKSRETIRNRYKEAEQIVSPKTDTISNADEKFMRKLNDLISSNLTNPDLDVQFVAAQMAMSRASLYNKLKLLAGISIGDYINKFRMAEAVRLLADKDLSIQEVSEKTGFSHQRYFSTVFKQIYGVAPSQYRQGL